MEDHLSTQLVSKSWEVWWFPRNTPDWSHNRQHQATHGHRDFWTKNQSMNAPFEDFMGICSYLPTAHSSGKFIFNGSLQAKLLLLGLKWINASSPVQTAGAFLGQFVHPLCRAAAKLGLALNWDTETVPGDWSGNTGTEYHNIFFLS